MEGAELDGGDAVVEKDGDGGGIVGRFGTGGEGELTLLDTALYWGLMGRGGGVSEDLFWWLCKHVEHLLAFHKFGTKDLQGQIEQGVSITARCTAVCVSA